MAAGAPSARPAPHPTAHKTRGGDPAGAERGPGPPRATALGGPGDEVPRLMMLTADEARQLDRFALAGGHAAASAAGRRPTKARGYSIEFHDFRRYQPGDDPRAIDWTVDARLRQLVVRLYRAEGHVPLHLLVDASASMQIGRPAKLSMASRIAAALAYVAVLRRDPVALALFDNAVRAHVRVAAGRPQLFKILETLKSAGAHGRSAIDRPLTDYGSLVRGPGIAVVVSDFFDRDFRFDGVRFLLHRGFNVALVHLLADEEIDPGLDDDAELIDVEDGGETPVGVSPAAAAAYRSSLAAFVDRLRGFCGTHGVSYLQLPSSSGFAEVVSACTRAGLIELHG